jgi:metal-sulfur cluster biosynthetic enzyme
MVWDVSTVPSGMMRAITRGNAAGVKLAATSPYCGAMEWQKMDTTAPVRERDSGADTSVELVNSVHGYCEPDAAVGSVNVCGGEWVG